MFRPAFVLAMPGMLAVVLSPVYAAEYRFEAKFQRGNPESGDLFGTSVVLEGSIAAIKSDSAYLDGDGHSVTHIFERQPGGGWTNKATLEINSGENPIQI